jgi:hypothetical protein
MVLAGARPAVLGTALGLWSAGSLGQNQRPLPRGAPTELAAPSLRVSVEVSEALEPDRLRALARPGVSAWVRTRSNTLSESTVENLARFDEAWVELRAPLSATDAAVFRRIPRAGAWGSLEAMAAARQRLPGARRLAVELAGGLDEERWGQVDRLRPAVVRWTPAGSVAVLEWALFRALDGEKLVVVTPELLVPVRCGDVRARREPAAELHLGELLAMSSDVFPCGPGARVIVEPGTEGWLLQSLVVRDPSLELVVSIGADAEKASRAGRLLDALGLGPPR